MIKHDFIIAYDISDAKRLRMVAKILEQRAMRIQYSIFYMIAVTHQEARKIFDDIIEVCDQEMDDLRIYRIKNKGIHMGRAVDLRNPFDFFGDKI